MGYMLMSGLSKMRIYNTIIDNNCTGILLPPARLCTFRRIRNTYYLNFEHIDCSWEVSVFQWNGAIQYRFTKGEHVEYQENLHYTNFPLHALPLDYLLKHKMLREVPEASRA